MTKTDRERTKKLIQTDLLTIRGGRGDHSVLMLGVLVLILLSAGFFVTPLVGSIASVVSGILASTEITQNEIKYKSARMYCVLPVSRRELVRARFVMASLMTLAVNVLVYLLMLLSLKLHLYDKVLDSTKDIVGSISDNTGGMISEFGVFNLFYSVLFAVGMASAGSVLRNYFRNSEKIAENMALGYAKNVSAKDRAAASVTLAVCSVLIVVLIYGFFTGELKFAAAAALVVSLISQLASAANGALLCAVFLTMGVFSFAYSYICTVIEYEDKDI